MLCDTCPKKDTCSEICEELENQLPKMNDCLIRDKYGKIMEKPVDPHTLEDIL